ncbi:MAG: DUF4268 domain-containing protein [Victivallales bacterium]|nr:DUF4268 domain-containing protein [Victivallales bacterium]
MDGKSIKLIKYLDGSEKRFIIPVYQRNYSWKIDNCRQLFDDLVKLSVNNRNMHFFGSLVSVYNGFSEEFLIIDGQQRITTISLLLLAIHNILKEGKLIAKDDKLIDKVYNKYLVDEYDPSEKRIKLKTVNKDFEAFEKLFDEEPSEYIPNSDITINYLYFYERIQKEELSIDDLYDAISKLMVINITVEEDDNPQLIFESLNSTGVDLTEGDKIRNFVLMGQNPENQELFYKKYWSKIEICTGNNNDNNNGVSLFIRDYLSVMRQSTPSMDKIYPVFKSYVIERNISIEELLKELLDYARLYEFLTKSQFKDDVVNASIYRLNYLETSVSRPFFMQVLNLHKQGILSNKDLQEIFIMVENYLFRRNICDVSTNALNKVFLTLNREIHRYDGTYNNYIEKMKFALTSKKQSGRFPDDQEFAIALSEKQVYLMRGHFKNYLFERFENFGTLETKDVFSKIENGEYTIEHIMPQTITPSWREALGNDYSEIHTTWLHRIANLTLTAYNSSYSNNPFIYKRDAENGFKNSGIRMNNFIAQKDKWTLAELEERNEYMVSKAKEIWVYPTTNYKPEEKQFESITLDDDFDMSGCQIAKFAYKDSEQFVDSWTDMYSKMLRILHAEDSSILNNLAYTSDSSIELAMHVSSNPDKFTNKVQIAPNIYIWTGTRTQYKLNTLKRFFVLFGADPADLIFYLKDQNETKDTENIPERNEIRKKYWTFALPYIQEKFGEGQPFCNVNPTTSNLIAGFFGVGGFNVICRANFDCASVQIYLGKFDKEKNKEAFDYLFNHKNEIEEKLGEKIKWERSDDIKASFMTYELSGVSVTNETDWIRMAKFHAEWSKKLCDVILPILKELYPSII